MGNTMKKITGILTIIITGIFIQGCGLLSDFGDKMTFGAGEVFYKDGATKDEAEKLGNYLLAEGFFDEESPKSVQISKKNDTYIFKMATQDDYIRDVNFERSVEFITMDLSADVFNNAKVDVYLTDEMFNTEKEIPFFGVRTTVKQTNIYRSLDVDAAIADKVTEYFANIDFIDEDPMVICYRIEGDDFVYELITEKNAEFDNEMVQANKVIAGLLSANVLNNKPVRINFLDTDYSVKKSFSFEEIHQTYMEFIAADSTLIE